MNHGTKDNGEVNNIDNNRNFSININLNEPDDIKEKLRHNEFHPTCKNSNQHYFYDPALDSYSSILQIREVQIEESNLNQNSYFIIYAIKKVCNCANPVLICSAKEIKTITILSDLSSCGSFFLLKSTSYYNAMAILVV